MYGYYREKLHVNHFWELRGKSQHTLNLQWPNRKKEIIYKFSQAKKWSSHFFFLHVSRAQHLAPARTRTQVVHLRAQCTDHWTTEQSHGIGVPAVHLTMYVKSSPLYGRTVVPSYGHTSKFFRLDGLLLFCIIMGLRSVSSAIIRSQ